ncbi:MAG: hypothetical protein E3J65_03595 [Dehalococcoidia bacterium]|nr:MAG: hypothetical protein E3J65_03595 [Dehalococcoidia bacterium]
MADKSVGSNLLSESFNPLRIAAELPAVEEYLNQLNRNQVRQIVISYHQTYDHLHEVLQNAVDACECAFRRYANTANAQAQAPYEPHIEVRVDVDGNKLIVADNGIGMTLDEVQRFLFTPYATAKPHLAVRQRGEKGVGNTFLSYGSEGYHFSTRHMDEHRFIAGRLTEGIRWTLGSDQDMSMPLVEPDEPHSLLASVTHGTVVQITFSEQTNIKRLADHGTSREHWEAILRLHTGVGYIDFRETDDFLNALKISLYVTHQGVSQSKIVQKGYLYPHKVTGVTSVRLGDLTRGDRGRLPPRHTMKHCLYDFFDSEAVKQKALSTLESYGRFGPARGELRMDIGRFRPRAYISFVWSSEFWSNVNQHLFGRETRELDHGIVFATKTQRVAEPKYIDFSFRTGDYNRFLVLLDMDDLEADIGRKSLERRAVNLGNLIADAFHNAFVENQDALMPAPRVRREEEEVKLEDLQNWAIQKGSELNLPSPPVALLKTPREEQDVVALFFNLLGSRHIKGYKFYATLISQQYDGVGYFEVEKAADVLYDAQSNPLGIPEERFGRESIRRSTTRNFIEFKMSTDDLIRDIQKGDKQLRDIKWLVCWTKGNRHTTEGITIDEILDEHQRGHREFYGVTDIMRDASGATVHVIRLEKVVQILQRRE